MTAIMPKLPCKTDLCLLVGGTLLLMWALGGCTQGPSGPVPTPTKTPRPVHAVATPIPTPVLPALPAATLPATLTRPPDTPAPASPTPIPPTPTAENAQPPPDPSPTPAPSATPPPPAASPSRRPTATQPPAVATQPPRRGGSWDLEEGFYPWQSPHEGFTAFVANGWLPLSKAYDPAAPPRLNENKYLPNVHSGERSQEISFDWRSGEAGIFRTVDVIRGHRYVIEAWARYVPSESGLGLYLGVDLGGGEDFQAGSVTWYPWRDMTPNQWIATRETVRASGTRMTIFLRAVHPLGADGGNKPGGNTMFDDVSVTDIGP